MWRVEHISAFWWLLTIPIIIILFLYFKRRREQKLEKLGDSDKIKDLIHTCSSEQLLLKRLIWLIAILLMILAMMNPQSGSEEETVTNVDSNIIVALDLSNSMLAKDIAPSRLEVSKKFLSNLVQSLGGDRIAFIVFAGKAYIQMPFTTDYGAFEMQLDAVNTDMMPTQGTALGEAIQLAESLEASSKNKSKILVLMSDGEDHDSKAIEMAKLASSKNMIIHTIGVGTITGAPIPDRAMAGGVSFKRDKDGNQILTRLNENTLKQIANAGRGKYFNISSKKQALKEIRRSLKWARTSTGEERVYTKYKSYFQWFLFPSIILLMFELAGVHILSFRESKKTKILLVLLPILFWISCTKEKKPYQADAAFKEGKYDLSLELYRSLLAKDSVAKNKYNFGVGLLAANKEDSALAIFEQVIQDNPDSILRAKATFNIGNILFKQSKYKEASAQFVNALKFSPDNYRAQYNLSLALAHLPPPSESPEQQHQQQNQQKDDSNQEEKKNQENKNNQEEKKNQENSKDQKDQKDSKDKSQNSEDKSQERKQEDNQQEENQSKQKPNEKPMNLSPQDIQRLFQALDQQEKEIQRRIMNQQNNDKSTRPFIEKDW
ncbi:MAG: VWA domain-containing protein [Chitinophagales bacterium]|nr:VWA domain-containing protein [Chitinophagales bacterium]MCZ2392692.1 VWA domain-containing protein [Chitinophagales bacterium]